MTSIDMTSMINTIGQELQSMDKARGPSSQTKGDEKKIKRAGKEQKRKRFLHFSGHPNNLQKLIYCPRKADRQHQSAPVIQVPLSRLPTSSRLSAALLFP
jgi:hypothetical protein